MDGLLLPFILFRGLDKTNQKALFEQMLPALIPGPNSQRLVVAAISAERNLKRQAITEQRLVEDAIKAGELASAADLAPFPALEAAFKRLPVGVQAGLFVARDDSPTPRRRPKGDDA